MQFLTYRFTSNFCWSCWNMVIKYPVHSLSSLKSKDISCSMFCFLYSSVFLSREKDAPSGPLSPSVGVGNAWLCRWQEKEHFPLSSRIVRWNQESPTWSRDQPCHLSPHPSIVPQGSLCPFSPWGAELLSPLHPVQRQLWGLRPLHLRKSTP